MAFLISTEEKKKKRQYDINFLLYEKAKRTL